MYWFWHRLHGPIRDSMNGTNERNFRNNINQINWKLNWINFELAEFLPFAKRAARWKCSRNISMTLWLEWKCVESFWNAQKKFKRCEFNCKRFSSELHQANMIFLYKYDEAFCNLTSNNRSILYAHTLWWDYSAFTSIIITRCDVDRVTFHSLLLFCI